MATVLIYRFWQARREDKPGRGTGARRGAQAQAQALRKSRQRLH